MSKETAVSKPDFRAAVAKTKTTFQSQFGEKAEKIFKREQGFAVMAIKSNSALQQCAEDSLIQAVATVALTGVSLNPATSLAYLVPRKGRAVLEISYMGMIEILRNSGSVKSIRANVVFEGDEFEYEAGTGGYIRHKPQLNREAGIKPIGAYAIASMPDGSEEFHFMDWNEILKRRDASDGANSSFSPWKKWPEEMAKKTVIRQFYKFLPKTEKATYAIEAHDTAHPHRVDTETGEVHEVEVIENDLI